MRVSKESRYKSVIIGAGSIGAMKPDEFDRPGGDNVLTISHAVYDNPDIELVGIYDINPINADKAASKWGCLVYQNSNFIPKVDVIFVACNTVSHLDQIYSIRNKAEIIICEKPFCSNLEEANEVYQRFCIDDGKRLGVNYSRSFEPEHIKLIDKLKMQEIYSVVVKYNRGLKRDGCHAINFINQFLGECLSMVKHPFGFNDYDINDTTSLYTSYYERCKNVVFVPVPGDKMSIFEIEVFCESGLYRLISNGLYIDHHEIDEDKVYGKYKRILARPSTTIETGLTNMLVDMVKNVVDTLDGKDQLKCTAQDAIKVHGIMEMV